MARVSNEDSFTSSEISTDDSTATETDLKMDDTNNSFDDVEPVDELQDEIDDSVAEPNQSFGGNNRFTESLHSSNEQSGSRSPRRSNYLTDRKIKERAESDPNFDAEKAVKERDKQSTAQALDKLEEVGKEAPNPVVSGVAQGLSAVNKATGGKSNEVIADKTSKALKKTPDGRDIQEKINAASAAASGDFGAAAEILAENAKRNIFRRLLKYVPLIAGILLIVAVVVVALIILLMLVKNALHSFLNFPYLPNNFANFITVKEGDSSQNIDIDTYVASVLYAEVGEFSSSKETLKAQAVAARTYALYKMQTQGYIGNGTGDQVSKMVPAAIGDGTVYMKAAQETSGVVLGRNSSLIMSQYDAFAANSKCGGGEDDENYILCQQGLKIPKEWARSNGLSDSTAAYYNRHFHGQGMSQWGAYYLAKGEGRDWEYILNYFYPDAELMSIYEYSFDPIEAKNTESNSELQEPLGEFLKKHGSSLTALNDEIFTAVLTHGPGTGDGVAAAAVTLVGIMDQEFNVKIPYYWAGGQSGPGVNSSGQYHNVNLNSYYGANKYWGELQYVGGSKCYHANSKDYCWLGLDCAGFVTWAIHTGGVKTQEGSTQSFYLKGKEVSVYNGEKASPGDILKHTGHIMLVLSYDKSNSSYKVAEAAGQGKGVRIVDKSVSYLAGADYSLYLMGDAYARNAIDNYEEAFESGRMD